MSQRRFLVTERRPADHGRSFSASVGGGPEEVEEKYRDVETWRGARSGGGHSRAARRDEAVGNVFRISSWTVGQISNRHLTMVPVY